LLGGGGGGKRGGFELSLRQEEGAGGAGPWLGYDYRKAEAKKGGKNARHGTKASIRVADEGGETHNQPGRVHVRIQIRQVFETSRKGARESFERQVKAGSRRRRNRVFSEKGLGQFK